MIKIIGPRRIIMLSVLLAVNAALATATYMYLMPQNEKIERDLRRVKGEISTKRGESERLRTEHAQILEQKSSFENLKEAGFLGHQDRFLVRDRMEAIQSYSRVLTAKYNIQPMTLEETKEAAQSNQVVLASKMDADVDAIGDLDVYRFIYWLENGFPGHITINNVVLRRRNEVNDVTLRQLGTGTPLVMVTGELDFEWRTMVPREEAGLNMTGRF